MCLAQGHNAVPPVRLEPASLLSQRFNISSENKDFGFNSFQKINFQNVSHLNALGSKYDLDIK